MARLAYPLAAVLFFAPVVANATIVRAVEFEKKVEDAAAIVVGTVVDQQSRFDAASNLIVTYSTLRIDKTLKGAPAQTITIVTPGGTVGNTVQEIIGVPKFQAGEENVVFVRNTQSGPTVLYLEQGNYKVRKNDRGDRIVTPAVSAEVLVDTGRGTAVAPEAPRTLRDFEGAVRDSVNRRERLRMEMLEKQKQEASIWNQLERNKYLVVLALLGVAIATWQLLKRS